MSQTVSLRVADRPGDLGWMVQEHGEHYARQLGWGRFFEAEVARIVADYAGKNDERQHGWIAELDGDRVGCILCVPDADPGTARLRILLVSESARGHGAGSQLVDRVIEFARDAGYQRIVLGTNSALASARRIYQAAGFVLAEESDEELYEQSWALDLKPVEGVRADI